MDRMRSLSFRYSIDYDEFVAVVTSEFEDWLDHEFRKDGALAEERVHDQICELAQHYVPSSPRQLLELAMQCEELLGHTIEEPIFCCGGEELYEFLRGAVLDFVVGELWMRWEQRSEKAAQPVAV